MGNMTKDVFAKALRAHQSVNDKLKSEHRDLFAEAWIVDNRMRR